MNDASQPNPATPNCPDCGSGHVETTDPLTTLREYRCRDCGSEFDEDGGMAVVE